MSISSYTELQTAVAMWLDRPDLNDFIPDFIRLAENRLNRMLWDNLNMVLELSLTFTDADRIPPDDFNGVVSLSYDTVNGGVIPFKPAAEFFNLPVGQSGIPQYYTVSAGKITIWPSPQEDIVLTLRYRTKFDLPDSGVNWLLENHPDAYLFGALVEGAGFIVEEPRLPMWQRRFDQTMSEISEQARAIAFGGPLQVKSCGGE